MEFALQGVTFRTEIHGAGTAMCAMTEAGTSCWFEPSDYSYSGNVFEAAQGFLADIDATLAEREAARRLEGLILDGIDPLDVFDPRGGEIERGEPIRLGRCWCGADAHTNELCERHHYSRHVAFGGVQ